MAVELLSVSLAAAARSQAEPEATPEPVAETIEAAPTYTPEREYEQVQAPEPAATTAVEEEQVTAEPVPLIADSESIQAAPSSAPTPEPAPTPESALTPEPVTPEPALTPEPAAPPVARRRYGSHDTELPVEVHDDEERRQHNEARRFARLLVSEIKLYNEQRVVEGRSNGDLYERLREYIDRSREMYDKRVKTLVSAKYDYFHHELVRTLAEGDASKLGDAYPGTTVSA
jgi:hypothetical protein